MTGHDLPAVNAVLNATSAALLVLGYLAIRGRRGTGSIFLGESKDSTGIRNRRVVIHKVCMLSALAVSIAFLVSYLYYHFVVVAGVVSRFAERTPTPPAWVCWAYYILLSSHTLLAIVAAPLALITAYLGLSDRLAGHVWLARVALPIWLYVSCTGVVVYWVLYHLYPPSAGGVQ